MNYYFTPSKSSSKRSSSTQVQEKPSDWICVVCNNLNFSFRKKCNRCKTQTRIQNETQLATAYSEYYFQNYLTSAKSPLTDITNSNTPEPSHQKYCEDGIPTSNFNETIISTIGKVLPFQTAYSILDRECWESINSQQKYHGDVQEKQEQEETSLCEFTEIQLQFLVKKILDEDQ